MIYKNIELCDGIGGIRLVFELTGKFEMSFQQKSIQAQQKHMSICMEKIH